ncbi:MAG: serine-threonine protein kinase, partial [Mycobacteriales bacterium]
MADDVAGFAIWKLAYDELGAPLQDGESDLLAELPARPISDLFIVSHGWNNNEQMALDLYEQFFERVATVLGTSPQTIGVAGIVWPSMRWPDEESEQQALGGAAGLDDDLDLGDGVGATDVDDATLFDDLRGMYSEPAQIAALDEAQQLLEQRPEDDAELQRFQGLLAVLAAGPDAPQENDAGEAAMFDAPARKLFDQTADLDPGDFEGGAAGLGDFGRLWSGAKQALRLATYWQMKKRGGVVGSKGLSSLIARLGRAAPQLRIHLVGHSFGARLVSYAVWGLPGDVADNRKPVKSVTLLQGAFSHFAFAPSLPHAPERSGALTGTPERVDGPVVVTHSRRDLAVGNLYPAAAIVGRDDAAALESLAFRWGAMGHDGAQHSGEIATDVLSPGVSYGFEAG